MGLMLIRVEVRIMEGGRGEYLAVAKCTRKLENEGRTVNGLITSPPPRRRAGNTLLLPWVPEGLYSPMLMGISRGMDSLRAKHIRQGVRGQDD